MHALSRPRPPASPCTAREEGTTRASQRKLRHSRTSFPRSNRTRPGAGALLRSARPDPCPSMPPCPFARNGHIPQPGSGSAIIAAPESAVNANLYALLESHFPDTRRTAVSDRARWQRDRLRPARRRFGAHRQCPRRCGVHAGRPHRRAGRQAVAGRAVVPRGIARGAGVSAAEQRLPAQRARLLLRGREAARRSSARRNGWASSRRSRAARRS